MELMFKNLFKNTGSGNRRSKRVGRAKANLNTKKIFDLFDMPDVMPKKKK